MKLKYIFNSKFRPGIINTILLFAIFFIPGFIHAKYIFNVEKQSAIVDIQKDGSAIISYKIYFYNDPYGQDIDIVDIGLPNDSYILSTAKASINEQYIWNVSRSHYIPIGVEIPLDVYKIKPGQRALLTFEIVQEKMVFLEDIDNDYASMEFKTNYFGGGFHKGTSDIEVTIIFPGGVLPGETYYHLRKYTRQEFTKNERLQYIWDIPDGDASLAYRFGVSFPKKYLERSAVQKVTWFQRIEMFIASVFTAIFHSPITYIVIIIAIVLVVIFWIKKSDRGKFDYYAPRLLVKGVGIKKGLTAVEAAVLLGKGYEKILTMIVFGLVSKGYLKIVDKKGLRFKKIKVEEPEYLYYEKSFFDALDTKGIPITEKFEALIEELDDLVFKKLQGFNTKMTCYYYEEIVNTAWRQIQAADLEDSIKWSMLDDRFLETLEDIIPEVELELTPSWWDKYIENSQELGKSKGYRPVKQLDDEVKDYEQNKPSIYFINGREVTIDNSSRRSSSSTRSYSSSSDDDDSEGSSSLTARQVAHSVAQDVKWASHNISSRVESISSPKSSAHEKSENRGSSNCACACAGCACACAGGGR